MCRGPARGRCPRPPCPPCRPRCTTSAASGGASVPAASCRGTCRAASLPCWLADGGEGASCSSPCQRSAGAGNRAAALPRTQSRRRGGRRGGRSRERRHRAALRRRSSVPRRSARHSHPRRRRCRGSGALPGEGQRGRGVVGGAERDAVCSQREESRDSISARLGIQCDVA